MSGSDWKARDEDRDAAIEVVEAAWADGQIVQADRDHRIESLLRAQTVSEIGMLVHDLQLPEKPVASAPVPNPYASSAGVGTVPRPARHAGIVGVLVLLAMVAAVGAGLVAAVTGITSSGDSDTASSTELPMPGAAPAEGVNVLSEDGYRDLVRAVKRSTTVTDAFEGVLYPGYAVLTLPVDRSSQRYDRWYWDGELEALDSRGTASSERFDLASVDAAVVVKLVKRVRKLVDDPTNWYAILRAPDPTDDATIQVYATNEFSESAYLSARRDGTVVYNSTKP